MGSFPILAFRQSRKYNGTNGLSCERDGSYHRSRCEEVVVSKQMLGFNRALSEIAETLNS